MGLRAHVFQCDEECLGFGDGHIVVNFSRVKHRCGCAAGYVLQSGRSKTTSIASFMSRKLARIRFSYGCKGSVVVADEVGDPPRMGTRLLNSTSFA